MQEYDGMDHNDEEQRRTIQGIEDGRLEAWGSKSLDWRIGEVRVGKMKQIVELEAMIFV